MSSQIPHEMLACQVVQFNEPYEIRKVPVPSDLNAHDILVKIAVSSYCHTDQMVQQGIFKPKLPCTASHEGAGTVAAAGQSVTKFQLGDRVLCPLVGNFCGKCPDCLSTEDRRHYCSFQAGGAPGIGRDGMFAEYAVVDSRSAAKLPDVVSFETAAPLACAGATVWGGILTSKLEAGQWLAIVGSGGGLGHICIKFAKAKGLKVIGIDARDEALKLSRDAGADIVLDVRKGNQDVVAAVQRATGGEGPNSGVDATINVSDAGSAAATACAVTKRHGLMVQIAQPENVSIPFLEFIFRDIRVHGSVISSPSELQEMVDFVAKHNITVDTVAFNGIEEIPKLVDYVHGGKLTGKAIVIVDPSQKKDKSQL